MPFVPRVSPRIAVVQFQPKIGQIQANIAKARELCRGIPARSVDLVCLPEMCFSGYVFESASAIQPHLETPRTGPTSRFAADLARRLECYVVAGYPELITPEEAERHFARTSRRVVGANSAVLCDPQGEWVGGYRKTNLFHVDETWALPGTGFGTFHLPPPLHTVALGICMDLNAQPPHDWTITHGPFELAAHCLETRANVLVLLNAWLDSGRAGEEESDMLTMNFWAERLRPLWVPNSVPSDPNPGNSESGERPETIVVVANRTGTEKGTTFAGSSAVFKMRRGGGKKGILRAALGRDEEDVMIWDDIAGC